MGLFKKLFALIDRPYTKDMVKANKAFAEIERKYPIGSGWMYFGHRITISGHHKINLDLITGGVWFRYKLDDGRIVEDWLDSSQADIFLKPVNP